MDKSKWLPKEEYIKHWTLVFDEIFKVGLKSRSGEMADTEDLKSSEETPHESSSLSSGISLKAILENRIEMYKECIKDPNHPYLKYLEELVKKYEEPRGRD